MKKSAVIVAGGSGSRMGSPVSKQFLPLRGRPILMHTLSVFFDYDSHMNILLVLPEADLAYWEALCKENGFEIPHQVVIGGKSRFQSVKNGLDAISDPEGLVAIHDGVRPFVSREVIHCSFVEAENSGSAIPVVPLKDSIRKVTTGGKSVFQDRSSFRLVQTPQTFRLSLIRQAFMTEELPDFTDDATVYEHQGWTVSLIQGNLQNIKVTTPEDLAYADFLLGMAKGGG